MSGFERLLVDRQVAGRYTIEKLIGRGGMGAVFRAADARLDRPVALKVLSLPPLPAQDLSRMRARFQREARAAASIVHPSVVTIYDYGTDPQLDLDYLAMELMEGSDLLGVMESEGPLAPERVIRLLGQAADGLAAGHARGIVHRDVKPGNLFLARIGSGESVRVLDFGIAQVTAGAETLTRLTQFGAAPLSPAYASPEQERGAGVLTPATDVFSLGLTALALLSGVPQRVSGSGQPLDFGPSGEHVRRIGLESVIRQCIRTGPADRYPDAASVAEALRALAPAAGGTPAVRSGETVPVERRVPAPARVPPVSDSARRSGRAGLVAIGVGGSLLAVALIGIGIRSYTPASPELPSGFLPSRARTVDEAIQNIRAVVRDADERKDGMIRRAAVRYDPNDPGYSSTSTAYMDGRDVRKIVDHVYRYGLETVVETYFWAGDVAFRYEHLPNPSEVTDGRRYYFEAGSPVRVRHDTRLIVAGTPEYAYMNPDSVRAVALAAMREAPSWTLNR